MSSIPITSAATFNTALNVVSSRISSAPDQKEAISKELEFLQEHLDFLVYHGTEIQVTDLNACQMRLVQVRSAFEAGISPLTPSTALTLKNRPEPDLSPLLFPDESMLFIFSKAIGNPSTSKLLGILSLVCKEWRRVASDDVLWKPIFQRCLENLTYDINDSSAANFKDKVKLLNSTNLKDFKKIIKELYDKNNIIEKELTRLGFKRFLKEHDLTDLIKELISKKELESIAKLLLFKPKIDANAICQGLRKKRTAELGEMFDVYIFIQELMLKLKYNIGNSYFNTTRNIAPDELLLRIFIYSPVCGPVNGLKITDYMANGWLFNPPKFKISSQLLFFIVKNCVRECYSTGKFQGPTRCYEVPFSDEKLQRYIRKSPPSEEDFNEWILDLLTKVGFDLDQPYPIQNLAKERTILSQLREIANEPSFPQPNALSKALAEYDQMQANKL